MCCYLYICITWPGQLQILRWNWFTFYFIVFLGQCKNARCEQPLLGLIFRERDEHTYFAGGNCWVLHLCCSTCNGILPHTLHLYQDHQSKIRNNKTIKQSYYRGPGTNHFRAFSMNSQRRNEEWNQTCSLLGKI